jgi:hypothetical protein
MSTTKMFTRLGMAAIAGLMLAGMTQASVARPANPSYPPIYVPPQKPKPGPVARPVLPNGKTSNLKTN